MDGPQQQDDPEDLRATFRTGPSQPTLEPEDLQETVRTGQNLSAEDLQATVRTGAEAADLEATLITGAAAADGTQVDSDTAAEPVGGALSTVRLNSGASQIGTQVGDYQIVKELARGAMGVVYVARHVQLDRLVAFKQVLAVKGREDKHLARFRVEAQALAKLNHPNIVRIHEVCLDAELPYLIMELVEGETLRARIKREGPLDPRESARLALALADGLAHAHEQDVLHRDFKPHNVILSGDDGRPKITDFGLARLTDERSDLTKTGHVIGTPGYMPPEQADGDKLRMDARSDVYAVGATLYCMLTGHAPFEGDSAMGVLTKVLSEPPAPPSELRPGLDADLETICLTCLEKDRDDRYKSARALARDLQRYLDAQRIDATRPSALVRFGRWVRADSGVSAALGLTTLALIGAAVWAAGQVRLQPPPPSPVPPPPGVVEGPQPLTAREVADGDARLADVRKLAPGAARYQALLAWLEEHPRHPGQGVAEALREIWRTEAPIAVLDLPSPSGYPRLRFVEPRRLLAFSRTSSWLAEWDLSGAPTRRVAQLPFRCQEVDRLDDGRLILAGSRRGKLVVATLAPGAPLDGWEVQFELPLLAPKVDSTIAQPVAFRRDGAELAVVQGASLRRFALPSGEPLGVLRWSEPPADVVAYSPDGRWLATSGGESLSGILDVEGGIDAVRVWDLTKTELEPAVFSSNGHCTSLGFSAEGRLLHGSSGGWVSLYDPGSERGDLQVLVRPGGVVVNGVPLQKAHGSPVRQVALTPDGKHVYTASGIASKTGGEEENALAVWDAVAGEQLRRFDLRDPVVHMACSPDGERQALVAGGQVQVWALGGP